MKATAKAHPIQGLIKYHGLKDERLRIPYHDSISVCTGPISTTTTVEPQERLTEDIIRVNGNLLTARELERAVQVLDKVRSISEKNVHFRVESANDFPTNIGLGASSSAFAALAKAACASLELDMPAKEVSMIARIGAGSAARSVTGGFSRWVAGEGDGSSYSYRLDSDLEMGMLAVVIKAFKTTEDAHRAVTSSPFFQARLDYVKGPLAKMQQAIEEKDVLSIGRLAEVDTMNLHGITMTSVDEMMLWQPETVRVIQKVRELRSKDMEVYFSIDTGATVYLNTPMDNVEELAGELEADGFDIMKLEVAGGAENVEEHLF